MLRAFTGMTVTSTQTIKNAGRVNRFQCCLGELHKEFELIFVGPGKLDPVTGPQGEEVFTIDM